MQCTIAAPARLQEALGRACPCSTIQRSILSMTSRLQHALHSSKLSAPHGNTAAGRASLLLQRAPSARGVPQQQEPYNPNPFLMPSAAAEQARALLHAAPGVRGVHLQQEVNQRVLLLEGLGLEDTGMGHPPGVRGVHLQQEVDQRVLLLQVPLAPQHGGVAGAARARAEHAALRLRRAQQLLQRSRI